MFQVQSLLRVVDYAVFWNVFVKYFQAWHTYIVLRDIPPEIELNLGSIDS